MAEYIEREALLKEVDDLKKSPWYNDDYGFGIRQARHDGVDCVVDLCIKQAPAADVVEVVHGEWVITHDFDDNYEAMRPLGRVVRCSVCGYPTGHIKTNFCPECGAKMRGDKK
jgi:rubrerythrin